MSLEIRLPALSSSMTEGHLVAWRRRVGERVEAGEVLAEIETDKATAELEAAQGGILAEILVPEGTENVAVGTLLARLKAPEEALVAPPVAALQPPADPRPAEPAARELRLVASRPAPATPLARRMAAHAGLDLATLPGSGPGGRISKADVEAALGATSAAAAPRAPLEVTPGPSPVTTAGGPEAPFHDVPLSRIRRTVARRLAAAKREVPHFYLHVECRVDALLSRRRRLAELDPGAGISLNDLVLRAAALALRETPEANVSWREDVLRQYERVDVAVAVATDAGLLTPVLRGADGKGLSEIAREMRALVARAREGKLAPSEMDGGTFGLSNLGMYGVQSLSPILNPPQACILGVGAALAKPVVEEGALRVGTVMVCTLSCDHRAIDGAVAARFLAGLQRRLEDPDRMLL